MKPRTRNALLLAAVLVGLSLARAQTASAPHPAPGGELRKLQLKGFGQVGLWHNGVDRGLSNQRPLLLLHAANAAASSFEMRPIWEATRGERPVYALDWPGFGTSDRPDVAYSPELMKRALELALQEIGGEVDVVALSLSGEWVTAHANDDGGQIASVALISPTGFGGRKERSEAEKDATLRRLRETRGLVFGGLRSRPVLEWFLSRSFVGPVPKDVLDAAANSSRAEGAVWAPLYFISGKLQDERAFENIYDKANNVPVLVIYDRDGYVNFDRLPEFAQKRNVTAVRIAPTLGMPHWEKREETISALREFWRQHTPALAIPREALN